MSKPNPLFFGYGIINYEEALYRAHEKPNFYVRVVDNKYVITVENLTIGRRRAEFPLEMGMQAALAEAKQRYRKLMWTINGNDVQLLNTKEV
jgi:hypothetical protein